MQIPQYQLQFDNNHFFLHLELELQIMIGG